MLRSTLALAALSLGLVAAPAVAMAQSAAPTDAAPPAAATSGSHHHHRHVLLRGIKLTSDQKTQLKAIRAKYKTQIHQARQSNDRDTVRQLRTQMVGEARAVLTPDQQKQFDSNLAAVHARRKAAGTTPTPSPAS
jgi:Spy/CpxP family protein refolding chaperone